MMLGIDFHTTSDGTMHEVDCGCPLLQARVPCGYLTSKGLDGSIACPILPVSHRCSKAHGLQTSFPVQGETRRNFEGGNIHNETI